MADRSSIEWTDATWNPVRGCSIVSKGCTNCYAMRQAHRSSGAGGAYEGLTKLTKGGPVWTGEIRLAPDLLDQPLRWRAPRRIFVNSMSDLFHEDVPTWYVTEVWKRMADCQQHIFQILTKRPRRMRDWLLEGLSIGDFIAPPLPNVWLGVSVEDQAAADERIPLLRETPAAVRWISAEPLLGAIELWKSTSNASLQSHVEWVVAGGESGPGARPMHPDWARSLRDQCAAAGVPFFFKQWGAWAPVGPLYAEEDTDEHLAALDTDPDEWEREAWVTGRGIWSDTQFQPPPDTWAMRRVGKKVAGRQLDGRTHDEYPA